MSRFFWLLCPCATGERRGSAGCTLLYRARVGVGVVCWNGHAHELVLCVGVRALARRASGCWELSRFGCHLSQGSKCGAAVTRLQALVHHAS